MNSPTLLTFSGQPVSLGSKIGGGGEGTVYEIERSPAIVAKVYNSTHLPDAQKGAKLLAMVRSPTESIKKVAAWPVDLLLSERDRKAQGFLMPKLTGFKEMHNLYTPKSRLAEFPFADWQFLIHAARNAALAVAAVHDAGHVVGDVNHGNFFVGRDALVRLIDCDSFQISQGGTTFLCEVGVATHTPPEMQGVSFSKTLRTANHDAFGLAVVIFQLLFLGRHPFSGIHLGSGDPGIEDHIKAFRFAYSKEAAARGMKPPPGGIGLTDLSPEAAELFERAFGPAGIAPGGRPTALNWAQGLEKLEAQLKRCANSRGHVYSAASSRCPWCAFEVALGKPIFNDPGIAHAASSFDFEGLLRDLAALNLPPEKPPVVVNSNATVEPQFLEAQAQQKKRVWLGVALGGILLAATSIAPVSRSVAEWTSLGSIAIGLGVGRTGPASNMRASAQTAFDEARARSSGVQAEWDDTVANITKLRKNISGEIGTYNNLRDQKAAKLKELEAQLFESQKRDYLDGFRIVDAVIPTIGDGRKAQLQSYNIETALDVDSAKLNGIHGFGPATISKLVAWRMVIESKFKFDPKKGVNPADLHKVEIAYRKAASPVEARLRTGLIQLRLQTEKFDSRRSEIGKLLIEAAIHERQARVNLDAIV
jgi:DNA-binding helix-hairpin-helix protein with protein kinase domain